MSSNHPIVSKCLYYTDQDRYILFFIRGISYWPVHQALPPFSSLHYTLFLLGKHTKFSECKPRHIAPFPAANMSCKLARAFFFFFADMLLIKDPLYPWLSCSPELINSSRRVEIPWVEKLWFLNPICRWPYFQMHFFHIIFAAECEDQPVQL